MTQDSRAAKAPRTRPAAETAAPAQEAKQLKVIVTYGCTMLDPITGQVYTTYPTPVEEHSVWLDVQLALGYLQEAP